MNPHDELKSLTELFPNEKPLFHTVEHVAQATVPEPYHQMLVHAHHMTVTMESFYKSPVDVRVLACRLEDDMYARKIVLLKSGTEQVVQFGLVRFDLSYASPAVREQILAREKPLGRVLIDNDVLRQIDLGAVLRIEAGAGLAELLHVPDGTLTYGRLATIFCDGKPAVDLLEIPAPLERRDGRSS